MKKLIPFLIVFLIIFYVFPAIIKTSAIVLAVSPILILITSLIYGAKHGFNILLSVFCALLFIPTLILNGLLFGVYLIAFFICSILGNALGLIFRKN
jgi:hypothetical protein